MADILDYQPRAEDVALGEITLKVRGLSNRAVFDLFDRFPALLHFCTGGTLDLMAIMAATPDCSVAIMMAGLGIAADDEARKAKLDALPMAAQYAISAAVVRCTCYPDEFGPFVSKLAALFRAQEETKAPAQEDNGGDLTPMVPPAVLSATSSSSATITPEPTPSP